MLRAALNGADAESGRVDRVNLGKAEPTLYQGMVELERLVTAALVDAGIDAGFAHLLRLRASQINQCAYCIRLHSRDALVEGESSDRIAVLPAWKETAYFDARERAALTLIEAITLIAADQLPDALYQEASAVLTPKQMAAIEWLGIVINSWNRIAIASRYPVRA